MKRELFTSVVFLAFSVVGWTQPNIQIEWQRTIGGSEGDGMECFAQTLDGGFILGGSSSSPISGEKTDSSRGMKDYWVVKTDDTGGIEWQKTFGGSEHDQLHSLAITTDGGYILGGTSRSGISGEKTDTCRGADDYWILKIDSSGVIEWQKTFGGGPDVWAGNDQLQKIIQTTDGGYMAAGYSNSENGDKTDTNRSANPSYHDYWILKLDNNGNIEWQKTVGGNRDDELHDLIQTSDGGYLLGGGSTSSLYPNIFPAGDKSDSAKGNADYWIVKLDSSGTIEWDKTIGGVESSTGGGPRTEYPHSITQMSDGGFLLAGTSEANISGDKTDTCRGNEDFWIVKIDSLGTIQWDKTFGGSLKDIPATAVSTSDGGALIHGYSYSPLSGDKTDPVWGLGDYWTLKINATGVIEWQKTLGGIQFEGNAGSEILAIETVDGKFLIGGSSRSDTTIGDKTDTCRGMADFWIIKLYEDCPDTTRIDAGEVCSSVGYSLPWGQMVYTSGDYTQIYPPVIEGSQCDSIVTVTLIVNQIAPPTIQVDDNFTLTTTVPYESYQWCLEGTPISGATQSSYLVSQNGDYTVIVTDSIECKDTSDVYAINNVGINGNDVLATQIRVYPNPANTMVHIETTSDLRLQAIRIVNLLGSEVLSMEGNQQTQQRFDVRTLTNGIYMLHIQTDNGMAVQKLEILR